MRAFASGGDPETFLLRHLHLAVLSLAPARRVRHASEVEEDPRGAVRRAPVALVLEPRGRERAKERDQRVRAAGDARARRLRPSVHKAQRRARSAAPSKQVVKYLGRRFVALMAIFSSDLRTYPFFLPMNF